jgi:hypothetical protein
VGRNPETRPQRGIRFQEGVQVRPDSLLFQFPEQRLASNSSGFVVREVLLGQLV